MLAVIVVSPARPNFDEISSTGDGMEAVTFHDQSAGMTVVWLQDSSHAIRGRESHLRKTRDAGRRRIPKLKWNKNVR